MGGFKYRQILVVLEVPLLFIASRQPYVRKIDKSLGDVFYPRYVVHGLAVGLVGG
jgi:hypothetical protein